MPAMVKADCFRFRLNVSRILPRFAAYQLSATAEATSGDMATGATRSRMNLTATATRKVAFPSLAEQERIVAFLDGKSVRMNNIRAAIEGAVGRLKELRSSLISAAVTGKIDVRQEPS